MVPNGKFWVAAGAALLMSTAVAAFDPQSLSPADRVTISELLEFDRTNSRRSLSGGGTVTVIATQTRPEICRTFLIVEADGSEETGVGCRVGSLVWEISAELPADDQSASEQSVAEVEAPSVRPGPPRRDSSGVQIAQSPVIVSSSQTAVAVPVPPVRPGQAAAALPTTAESSEPTASDGSAPVVDLATLPLPPLRPVGDGADPTPEETTVALVDVAEVPLPPRRPGAEDAAPPVDDATITAEAEPATPAAGDDVIVVPAPEAGPTDLLAEAPASLGVPDGNADRSGASVTEDSVGPTAPGLTETDRDLAPFQVPVAETVAPPGAEVPAGAEEIIIVADGPSAPREEGGFESLLARLTGDEVPNAVDASAPPIVPAESVLSTIIDVPLPLRRPPIPEGFRPLSEDRIAGTPEVVSLPGVPLPPVRPDRG